MATLKKFGPAFLGASAANVYTPPASTIRTIIRKIHLCNVTGAPVTFSLYIGATGGSTAGTELFKGKSIAANDVFDSFDVLVMSSTDFLTGLASAGSSITITVEAEQEVV